MEITIIETKMVFCVCVYGVTYVFFSLLAKNVSTAQRNSVAQVRSLFYHT